MTGSDIHSVEIATVNGAIVLNLFTDELDDLIQWFTGTVRGPQPITGAEHPGDEEITIYLTRPHVVSIAVR